MTDDNPARWPNSPPSIDCAYESIPAEVGERKDSGA